MSILFGKQMPVSDKSNWYPKVIRDLIQVYDTIVIWIDDRTTWLGLLEIVRNVNKFYTWKTSWL